MSDDPRFEGPATSTTSITEDLKTTFDTAVEQHAQGVLRRPKDWAAYQDIDRDHETAQDALTTRYHDDYDARVETERQRLYNEKSDFDFNMPGPDGSGSTDDQITAQAHRNVQTAHRGDLEALRSNRNDARQSLMDQAQGRDQNHGMACDAFAQSTDRRTGPDRRAPRQSQD